MNSRWPSEARLLSFLAMFAALSVAVGWRLYALQISRHDHYVRKANDQQLKTIVLQPERGLILDRRGRTLATSVSRYSAYVDPGKLPGDPVSWAGLFAEATHQSYNDILRILERNRPAPLARRMDPADFLRMAQLSDQFDLGSNALWFHRESQRRYPRAIASHLLGYCTTDGDGDNQGLSGLELQFNEFIKGAKVYRKTPRSAVRTTLSPIDERALQESRGQTLVLTIDSVIQEAAERALAAAVEKHNARSGVVLIQRTKTGAILAACAEPTFDNNTFSKSSAAARRPRFLTDPMEPGSTAKCLTFAMLFERNRIRQEELINCHGGRMRIHGRWVVDSPGHTLYWATPKEIFRWSSNVGTVEAAQRVTNEEYYETLTSFGIGRPAGIDLPGESGGILRPVSQWTNMSRSSLPMGYEFAATPLQILNTVSGILNEGRLMKPYIVAERRAADGALLWKAQPEVVRQIVRPSTSAIMKEFMEDVVTNGTGKKASIISNGGRWRAGGKTGTTRKSDQKHREYIASFIGAIPINDPEITIFVAIDSPRSDGLYYASDVACPLFAEVAKAALSQLAIPPSFPPEAIPAEVAGQAPARKAKEAQAKSARPAQAASGDSPGAALPPGAILMPDLAGLTMAEARRALREKEIGARFSGRGIVVDQTPPAGAPVEKGAQALVVFRDTFLREEAARQSGETAKPETTSSSPKGKTALTTSRH